MRQQEKKCESNVTPRQLDGTNTRERRHCMLCEGEPCKGKEHRSHEHLSSCKNCAVWSQIPQSNAESVSKKKRQL